MLMASLITSTVTAFGVIAGNWAGFRFWSEITSGHFRGSRKELGSRVNTAEFSIVCDTEPRKELQGVSATFSS